MKLFLGILCYEMADMAARLVLEIEKITKIKHELIVFDNGSIKPLKCATHRKEKNISPVDGYNEIAKLAKEADADYVWFITHDIFPLTKTDMARSMIEKCMENPNIGVIHPSVDEYAEWFKWMYHNPKGGVTTGHKFLDFIAPMYTREAMDILGWEFDRRFWSWGIDQDSCFQLRLKKKQIAIDHDVFIHHEQGKMVKEGLTKWKTFSEFCAEQGANFETVMKEKYGAGYRILIDARLDHE